MAKYLSNLPMTPSAHTPQDQASGHPVALRVDRGLALIQQLESLVVPPTDKAFEPSESTPLVGYSMGFQSVDIARLVVILKKSFPDELYIAADIGGYYGTAAKDLEQAGCDYCFVIDPTDARTGSSSQLPANRFIQRKAENMEGVPDDCFQFIISFNALTYSNDLARALSEIFRTLRPGGTALVDIEWWSRGKDLVTLRDLVIPENIDMRLIGSDETQITLIPLQDAIKLVSENQSSLTRMLLGTGFLIEKN